MHPETSSTRFVSQIVSGLRHLHTKQIIHGDLHCDSITIDDAGNACITDAYQPMLHSDPRWGLSNKVRITDFYRPGNAYDMALFFGFPEYMPPELFFDNDDLTAKELQLCTFESDVYACAMVLFAILHGSYSPLKKPWLKIPRIREGDRSHQGQIPDDIWSLLVRCWAREPSDRP
ncbi:kinase-like domain-containing protein, partial [Mycena floridula]